VNELKRKVKSYPALKGSSMLSDYQAGRKIELGAKNGAIIQAAVKSKISAPFNTLFINWLKS